MSTRFSSLARGLLSLGVLALPAVASAQTTFDFDNVGTTFSYVGATYSPFVFGGTAQVVQDGGGYGVLGCATSGQYCLYNGNGSQNVTLARSDAGTFTLGSGYFTSWFGSTNGTVVGMLGGSQVFSQSFSLGSAASLVSFGNQTVDQVQFYAQNASGAAGYFLADDITVNAPVSGPPTTTTPEPASIALFATGALALGIARRRRA